MKLPFISRDRDTQGNFDALVKRLGIERIGGGSLSLTWTASADSAVATVTHNLGWTPRLVLVSPTVQVGTRTIVVYTETPGATTFRAFGRADGAFSGTISFPWVAFA